MLLPRLLVGTLSLLPSVHAIWPIPREITSGDDVLFIDQTLTVTYNGASVCWTSPDFLCPGSLPDTEILIAQLPYTHEYTPSPGPK